MRTLSILIVTLAWITNASALYETPDEFAQKYGPCLAVVPADVPGGKMSVYGADGFNIYVTFLDGKAQSIGLQRPDKKPLTSAEMATLLLKQGDGSEWRLFNTNEDGTQWFRADGRAVAHYMDTTNMMIFMTPEIMEMTTPEKSPPSD